MTHTPLRLGFIGGGMNSAVGSTHFIASQMDGLFRVEAGCFSRNSEVNLRTANKWNICSNRTYHSWQSLLETEQDSLDAVVVLTPTPDHPEQVMNALRMKYPVICEKALAACSTDAAMIDALERDMQGFLGVTYNYSGYPMLRELRAWIQDNRFGRVEQVQIEMPQEGFARLNQEGNPFIAQQWRLVDGVIPTISLDLGVHLHHLIDFLTGAKPMKLVASHSSFGRYQQVIDNVNAIVCCSGGIECNLWYSKSALGYRNGLQIRVFGEQGAAEWRQMNPEVLLIHDNRGRTTKLDRASVDVKVAHLSRYNRFKAGHPAGFLEAFANLYADLAATLNGEQIEDNHRIYSASYALEGLRFLEAMANSVRERRWVALDD